MRRILTGGGGSTLRWILAAVFVGALALSSGQPAHAASKDVLVTKGATTVTVTVDAAAGGGAAQADVDSVAAAVGYARDQSSVFVDTTIAAGPKNANKIAISVYKSVKTVTIGTTTFDLLVGATAIYSAKDGPCNPLFIDVGDLDLLTLRFGLAYVDVYSFAIAHEMKHADCVSVDPKPALRTNKGDAVPIENQVATQLSIPYERVNYVYDDPADNHCKIDFKIRGKLLIFDIDHERGLPGNGGLWASCASCPCEFNSDAVSVGGVAGVLDDAAPSAEAAGGSGSAPVAAMAAVAVGAFVALVGGGWYTRRRWVR
jgi:hypothetical protein